MADLSPIMTLFREWEAKYRQAGDMSFEEEVASGLMDECGSLEKRIMALPTGTMQDFAAKLIVGTRYGDFELADVGKGGLIDEAQAILDCSLSELMSAHTKALAAWDALGDGQSSEAATEANRRLDATREAIFAHRPASLAEVSTKAAYMAATRSIYDWEDFDQIKLIEALTPAGGAIV